MYLLAFRFNFILSQEVIDCWESGVAHWVQPQWMRPLILVNGVVAFVLFALFRVLLQLTFLVSKDSAGVHFWQELSGNCLLNLKFVKIKHNLTE